MSDNPTMPWAEAAEEKKRKNANPPPHRPFHQDDLRAGAEALSRRLAMGSPFDVIVAVREILDASGCVSSRVMRASANGKKGQEHAQPSSP
jgi:hypothetical protein